MSTAPQAPSEEQVLAEMRHWIEQAVIGLNLCPFAKSVYVKNQVRIVVSQARNIDAFLDDLDRELELLQDTPAEQVDTTLLVHPTLFPDFFVFNDFLDLVDEVVEEHELEGIVQVAPFHPAFQFEDTEPDDADNLTNRAPYATLHLLREASIDRAVESGDSAEDIVERNLRTVRALGLEGWKRLLATRSA